MSQKKNTVKSLILYAILSGSAVVVLLPIFWTLLTACKQPGQASQWTFWPQTTVINEGKKLTPLASDLASLTIEYHPEKYPGLPQKPNRVALASSENEWSSDEDYLIQDGSSWYIVVKDLAPGKIFGYQFVVDGTIRTPNHQDIGKKERSELSLQKGYNSNVELFDDTKVLQDKIVFRVKRSGSENVNALVTHQEEGNEKKEQVVVLQGPDASGYFAGEMALPVGKISYQIQHDRSFGEAFSALYTLNNFVEILNNKDFPFGSFFLNSFIVAFGTAFLTVLLCTMAGYAFSKKKFWGRDFLFMILLSSMMIPGMIFMVPQFILVSHFNWINTYQGMIVPHLANVFGLFLMRQYIDTVPNSLFEAARIDGAREWQIFRIIVIPISLPIITTLFLLTFVGQWSNFLWQLIVNTPDSSYRTLPVGLALFKGQYGVQWELMMAGACFSIIPISILFLFSQRFFIAGMTQGAVKE